MTGRTRPKPNIRVTSRKVAASISQKRQKAKRKTPNRTGGSEPRPRIRADFVAPHAKAKSSGAESAESAVHSWLADPVSQLWAHYFAPGDTSVGLRPSSSSLTVVIDK